MIIEETWKSLEASAPEKSIGYVKRRVKAHSICDLFLAVIKPSNQHALHMRVKNLSVKVVANLPTARGLDISIIYPENDRSSFTIQLALKEERFNNIFNSLVNDIVEIVAHSLSETNAVKAFISRLRHWQKFLEQVGPEGLSREAQQGLYGELWFLREKLISIAGAYPSILAWTGPGGAHQDFQLHSCAVEVKTTATKEPQLLIIQSERQLDDTGMDALFLMHLSIDARESVGETLMIMIDSIRELLKTDSDALELYETKLLEAGFLQLHAPNYEKTGFNVRHASLYQVKDTFPRIISNDLKPGVGSVHYSIVASECRHFAISDNELKSQLTGMNNGN